MLHDRCKTGFTLIEVAVSVTLLAMVLLTCFKLVSDSLIYTKNTGQRTQGYYLASQGIEAVKLVKIDNPADPALTNDGTYYPSFDSASSKWKLSTDLTYETADLSLDNTQFHRQVAISAITGLTNTKKIISTVWWGNNPADKIKSAQIIYDISI